MRNSKNCYLLAAFCCMLLLGSCNKKNGPIHYNDKNDPAYIFIEKQVEPLFFQRNFDSAKFLLDSLQPVISSKPSNDALHFHFLRQYIRYYLARKQFNNARIYYDSTRKLIEQAGNDTAQVIKTKLEFSGYFVESKERDSALYYAKEAYNFVKRKDTSSLPSAALKLSRIYAVLGDHENNRKYLFEAYESTKNIDEKALASANIVKYYLRKIQIDSADLFYNRVIKPDSNIRARAVKMLQREYAHLLLTKGRRQEAYAILGEARKEVLRTGKDKELLVDIYMSYGAGYRWGQNNRLAIIYYDSAADLARKTAYNDALVYAIYFKSRCIAALGDYKAAAQLLDSVFFMHSKIMDSSFGKQNRELEMRYDVKLRDKEINNLESSNKATKAQSLLQRYLIISLAALLVLATIIFLQRNKKRKLEVARQKAEAGREKIQLEQQLLRTQMEPHFIFNTLATLQAYIRSNNNDKAEMYLSRFAKLLRSSLENSRESVVALEEEITALENYLALQAMRFENSFDYSIRLYEGFEKDEVFIPPMLLQPFVENAILHGLQNLGYKGTIDIVIEKSNNSLQCRIEDNGKGLQADIGNNTRGRSLATRITKERLHILQQLTSNIAYVKTWNKTAPENGTITELVIPFIRS